MARSHRTRICPSCDRPFTKRKKRCCPSCDTELKFVGPKKSITITKKEFEYFDDLVIKWEDYLIEKTQVIFTFSDYELQKERKLYYTLLLKIKTFLKSNKEDKNKTIHYLNSMIDLLLDSEFLWIEPMNSLSAIMNKTIFNKLIYVVLVAERRKARSETIQDFRKEELLRLGGNLDVGQITLAL